MHPRCKMKNCQSLAAVRLMLYITPKAIEMANAEVIKVKNKAPCGARLAPYLTLIPAQRYEVGKRATEHGITAALCYFAKK